MVQDPYKVLDIQPGASQDEIKRAYRKKAKENHPDLHPDDPQATAKMNEINEAYDMLMNPQKYQQRREQEAARQQAQQQYRQSYGYGPQQGYGSQGGWYGGFDFDDMFGFGGFGAEASFAQPTPEPGDSDAVRRAVEAINQRQYTQAASYLGGVVSAMRNARWYYLSALSQNGLGNAVQALDFMRRAVQLDPNNLTYRRALQQLQQAGQSYQQQGRAYGMDMNSANRMCMTLCAANLFCNLCCGGRFFCC